MEMKKYKLSEICKNITDGEQGTVVDSPNGEYFLLSNKNISDGKIIINSLADRRIDKQTFDKINKRTRLEKDDVLISTVGTLGKLCIVESNFNYTVQRSVGIIKPNQEKLISKYLKYLLMSNTYQNLLNNTSKGAVQKCIFIDDLKNLEVSLPSLEIQQKIATVLSSLEDKIALNRRINAKLEQMAKHLYDHWFVQFDFPNAEGKPYKASGGKMVYNETLKREIPEGWEVKKISDLLECDISGDWGEEEIKGKHKYKVNCIRGCDMVDMTNLPVRYILESNSKKLLKKDDFVIEISGGSPTQSTGRIVQITDEIIKRFNGKVICSNFCHGIRINDKDYVSYFLQMWNMFYVNNIFFNYEGKTSGLKNFQFDTFVSESWYFPPKELVRKYHEVVSEFRKQIDKNESETQKLISLRDKLLPLLMNGQVNIM